MKDVEQKDERERKKERKKEAGINRDGTKYANNQKH